MNIFKGDNFSDIYYRALDFSIKSERSIVSSRNGLVRDMGPSFFEISEDNFRLPLLKDRRFNPFFALTEFSWLITGSNALEPLQYYIKSFSNYSDDGLTLHGAYGHRLRSKFMVDQIDIALDELRRNPDSRRVVLTMWSFEDLGAISKDIPCNTSIMLKIRDGKLDLTVINRSNDLFLGVPYNVLIFYLLQCYMADKLNLPVGYQRHFTDSLHLYLRDFGTVEKIINHNSLKEIEELYKKLSPSDTKRYIEVQHEKVIERDFEFLNDKTFKLLFQSYESYKETGSMDSIINSLPRNYMGYAAFLWFSGLKGMSNNIDFFS